MNARQIVSEEWGRAVDEFELRPGSITERVVSRIISRFDEELNYEVGRLYRIDHDGFEGHVIGTYHTREGKVGVVLQQNGTQVVHVYSRKWLKP
jgi:hypothetical protein